MHLVSCCSNLTCLYTHIVKEHYTRPLCQQMQCIRNTGSHEVWIIEVRVAGAEQKWERMGPHLYITNRAEWTQCWPDCRLNIQRKNRHTCIHQEHSEGSKSRNISCLVKVHFSWRGNLGNPDLFTLRPPANHEQYFSLLYFLRKYVFTSVRLSVYSIYRSTDFVWILYGKLQSNAVREMPISKHTG